jgi:plastocyanin
MLGHMVSWNGGTWALLAGFLVLLLVGVVVSVRALGRAFAPRDPLRAALAERLACGDISPEEYQERLAVLGGESRRVGALGPVAVSILAVGVAGTLVVAAVGPGSGGGFMHHHMMGGMGAMMGDGQPGRSAPEPAAGAPEIRVVATEFSFRPAEIRVQAGKTVNVVVANDGMMFHTLTASEIGFELRADAGTSIGGALRVERPGSYPFICSVRGHAQAGMRARIVVGAS